jgi:hypothetical protein
VKAETTALEGVVCETNIHRTIRGNPVLHSMSYEPKSRYAELLNLRRLPARLQTEEVAAFLGFKPHDIPILVREGLLKPLASGPRNCVKYFSAAVIEGLARDDRWLDKATKAVLRRRQTTSRSAHTEHPTTEEAA